MGLLAPEAWAQISGGLSLGHRGSSLVGEQSSGGGWKGRSRALTHTCLPPHPRPPPGPAAPGSLLTLRHCPRSGRRGCPQAQEAPCDGARARSTATPTLCCRHRLWPRPPESRSLTQTPAWAPLTGRTAVAQPRPRGPSTSPGSWRLLAPHSRGIVEPTVQGTEQGRDGGKASSWGSITCTQPCLTRLTEGRRGQR